MRRAQTGQYAQEARLAAAIGAAHQQGAPGFDPEAEAAEQLRLAATAGKLTHFKHHAAPVSGSFDHAVDHDRHPFGAGFDDAACALKIAALRGGITAL